MLVILEIKPLGQRNCLWGKVTVNKKKSKRTENPMGFVRCHKVPDRAALVGCLGTQ